MTSGGSSAFGVVKFHYSVEGTDNPPIRRVGDLVDATYELTDDLKAKRLKVYAGATLRANGHDMEIEHVVNGGTIVP